MTFSDEYDVRALAFYLPQFHAIPENDEWWGEGFTEWTNVRRAEAQFSGHSQPIVPKGLGYYSLDDPAVLAEQAELASSVGLEGFVFYHYWFDGKRLLEKPVEAYIAGQSTFPFALCWANENWTRRWDGKEREVLLRQPYGDLSAQSLYESLAPFLHDRRYIRVGRKRLLLIHKPADIPNTRDWTQTLRAAAAADGIELYLCGAGARFDPASLGLDAGVKFPPLNLVDLRTAPRRLPSDISPTFTGSLLDYRAAARRMLRTSAPGVWHEGVMPRWDNTARRRRDATVFVGANPDDYSRWLAAAARKTAETFPDPSQRLLFVNAWNEWAEGAMLEPEAEFGDAYLTATRDALAGQIAEHVRPTRFDLRSYARQPHAAARQLKRMALGSGKQAALRVRNLTQRVRRPS